MNIVKKDWKEYLKDNNFFDYLIADPPWRFDDKPPKVDGQLSYSLWDDNKKCLNEMFDNAKSKHYLIWIPTSLLPDLISVVAKRDDLDFKTLLTWVKTTSKGKIHYGLGHTLRNSTEQLAFVSSKGNKPMRLNIRNVYHGKTKPRTGKPRELEKILVSNIDLEKNKKGVYLFSGSEDLDIFMDFNIDLVDII